MAIFENTLFILEGTEGATFVDDPIDAGGPTKYGITLSTMQRAKYVKAGVLQTTVEHLKAFTPEDVKAVVNLLGLWKAHWSDDSFDDNLAFILFDFVWGGGTFGKEWVTTFSTPFLANPNIQLTSINQRLIALILNASKIKYLEGLIAVKPNQNKFRPGWFSKRIQASARFLTGEYYTHSKFIKAAKQ